MKSYFSECFHDQVIEPAFQHVARNRRQFEAGDLELHFVYAGNYFNVFGFDLAGPEEKFKRYLLQRTMKHEIKSVSMTMISVRRGNLVSYEMMESRYKIYHFNEELRYLFSDLNSIFEYLRTYGFIQRFLPTYFFTKLTKEELALVGKKDLKFLNTFISLNPDVVKLLEHDSKYVSCDCFYQTFKVNRDEKVSTFDRALSYFRSVFDRF